MDQNRRTKPGTRPETERARHAESSRAPRVRHKKRKRRLRIFYALMFLVVLGAAVTLSLTVLFQIHSIQVTGTSRYSQEQIIAACGIQKGENLFLAKTKQAQKEIAKKLPYIGDVKVSRKLPAEISIQVESAQVAGAVATGGSYTLLTSSGKVLEQTKKLPEKCTLIVGLALSSAVPGEPAVYKEAASRALYEQIMESIKNNALTTITKIDISDPYRILMVYDGRITMNLGSSADLDYKIRFGKTILDGKNAQGEDNIRKDEKGVLNLSSAKEDDRAYFDPNGIVSSSPAKSTSASTSSSTVASSAVSSAA